MPPTIGQDRGQFATQRRDITEANQALTFPRGTINHYLFHNEKWIISKDSYNERHTKFDCCNIKKNGHPTSINCAFKILSNVITNNCTRSGFR